MLYKNTSFTTQTFYGVEFNPGEIKEVPGYINSPNFIKILEPPKEPPKVSKKKLIEADASKMLNLKQEEKLDGTDNNQ